MPNVTNRVSGTLSTVATPTTTPSTTTVPLLPPSLPGRDAPVDLFDRSGGAPVERSVATPHAEIPTTLLTAAGTSVEHGTDPGNFYCEHAFFTLQRFATEVGIKKNAQGEPLCGFLHVPWDADCGAPPTAIIDPAKRYAAHRKVVGAAIQGWFQAAKAGAHDPIKILITGYGPFQSITNNPAAGFVSHRENLDAAMKAAFGTALIGKKGKLLQDRVGGSPADTMALRYRVNDEGRVREIVIVAERLKVADVALDNGDPGSLVGALKAVKPDAALALGVHGGATFLAEHHADDGGLVIDAQGKARHDDNKQPTMAFLDNYALARAIHTGGQRGPARVADARTGNIV
ncbi:MAG: hypothetical protein A2138_16630 [Deltaproteobacteria bacterium RBG_16_71_12]|nr:MAG: hypothetical protein A2138_16630 [Deltaproteobacteria bacterium RBG_16_71_12]